MLYARVARHPETARLSPRRRAITAVLTSAKGVAVANGEQDISTRVENLEKAQEVAAATQATAMAGMSGAMIAGSAGLVAGMLLGVLLARA
jgi:tetrahydromethanopterin S-methyltransferase subunit F